MELRRRPFFARFMNSYRLWRDYLPVVASLRAAWHVATAR